MEALRATPPTEAEPLGYTVVEGTAGNACLCVHGPDELETRDEAIARQASLTKRNQGSTRGPFVACKVIPLGGELEMANMTLDLASPRVIYDVHAESWAYVTADKERYARLLSWAREQGLVPEDIYRLEVYASAGQPSVRVFEYAIDDRGHRYFACRGDHERHDECVIAKREPYTKALSSLPPDC